MSVNIDPTSAQICQTQNQMIPDEGPKAIPINLDFSGSPTFQLDLKPLQDQKRIAIVQCLWIDNAGNSTQLVVTINGSNQQIVVKANTQGYYPVLVPNPARFGFQSTQGQNFTNVFLLNMPISGCTWNTQ